MLLVYSRLRPPAALSRDPDGLPSAASKGRRLRRSENIVPYVVIFNPQDAFAEMRVSGKPTLEERDRAIDELLATPGFGRTTPILVDGRRVETLPDRNALLSFAGLHARRLPGNPLAYLMAPGVGYGVAREISAHIEMEGVEVEAFLEESEAIQWLRKPR